MNNKEDPKVLLFGPFEEDDIAQILSTTEIIETEIRKIYFFF